MLRESKENLFHFIKIGKVANFFSVEDPHFPITAFNDGHSICYFLSGPHSFSSIDFKEVTLPPRARFCLQFSGPNGHWNFHYRQWNSGAFGEERLRDALPSAAFPL